MAIRGHQAPRKTGHCLRKEVGQNIKDKKRDKRAKDGDPSREGSLNRGSLFPNKHLNRGVCLETNTRKPWHWQVWGKFSKLGGQPNWEEK